MLMLLLCLFLYVSSSPSLGIQQIQSIESTCLLKPFVQHEIANLLDVISHSYARELMRAGLFQNETAAEEAAKQEVLQEEPSEQNYFFHITSPKDSVICGYVWYSVKGNEAFLRDIFIKDEYRGKGIGTQILQDLEYKFKQGDFDSIGLHVFAHNQRAFELYKRLGYEAWVTNMKGDKIVGFVMRKDLKIR